MSKAAEASKDKGNLAFRQAKYPLALAHYTTSIQLDPSSYLYPLNRSLVHLKLGEWKQAEKDATVALDLDPVEASKKAYYRRALARKGMAKYKLAVKDLEQAKEAGAEPNDIDQEISVINKLLSDSGVETTQHTLPLPPPPIPNKPPAAPSELPKTPSTTSSVEESSSEPPPPPLAQPPWSGKSVASSKDRLRAALASPPASSTKKESAPAPSSDTNTTKSNSNSTGDLMTVVSTRSLTQPSVDAGNVGSDKKAPSSFAAKKQERTSRFASSAPVKTSSKTAPKSVPPLLATTATTTTSASSPTAATAAVVPVPLPIESPPKAATTTSANPLVPNWTPTPHSKPLQLTTPQALPHTSPFNTPMSSTTFEQTLSSPSLTPSDRLTYLRSIPPPTLPTLLKGGALTPDLLTLIIQALSSSSTDSNPEYDLDDWLLRFLHHLAKVDRFDMNGMFLEEAERGLVRGVFERAEKGLRSSRGRWGV